MTARSLVEDVGRRAPALLFTTDPQGRIEYVNDRWYDILGTRAKTLAGNTWSVVLHPDDAEEFVRAAGVSLVTGESYRRELRVLHRDGAYRWIEMRAEAERAADGTIVRWFGAGSDVDAQHRAMDALQLLAESGASATSASDVDTVLENVARTALAGLADIAFFDLIEGSQSRRVTVAGSGVPRSSIDTVNAFPAVVNEPHPISRAMTDVQSVHVERVDEAFILRAISDPVRQQAWRTVGIRSIIVAPMIVGERRLGALSMLRTLSQRPFEASDVHVVEEVARRAGVSVENIRLTEAARRESAERETRFRTIADSMPMLMWTTRPDGSAEWFNQRWHEYTGLPETDDIAGWLPVHHDDLPKMRAGFADATRRGSIYEGESRLRRHDGIFRWFLTRAMPERDESGAIVRWYGTDTDIDDVRRAQRTLYVFSELGPVLSAASLEVQATLDAVMHVVVPEFADWAIINLADDNDDLRVAAIYHRDESKRALLATQLGKIYAHGSTAGGAPNAIRTNTSVLYEDAAREDAALAVTPDVRDCFWKVGFSSVLVTPLIAGSNLRGTLNVAMFDSARRFGPADIDFFQELARRIAPAIANAELFERERLVARSFQDAALPASLPELAACSFSAIYEAGRAEALVGGDWYDAFALADGRIVLSIGDVAGSGLLAAVTMANMRQAIRGVAYVHPDPILMLEAADLALRSESPDRFVTAFVAVIDPIENMVAYTTAGHPPPLLRGPSGSIEALNASGLPLGLREHDGTASEWHPIEPGSTLVLYTDGLVESTHDIEEGLRRLETAMRGPGMLEGNRAAARLRDAVLLEGSHDDVAILCASYAGVPFERRRVDVRNPEATGAFAAILVAELKRNGYADDAIVNAEVVLSELVGNLVRHTPGPATFVIDPHPHRVLLHVLDDGPGYRFLSRLPTDTLSERGRGLFLISALAEAFHVTVRAQGGSHACVTFSSVSSDGAKRIRW